MSDSAPTTQESMVYEGLASQVNAEIRKLDSLLKGELAAFNTLVRNENVPAVVVPEHPPL